MLSPLEMEDVFSARECAGVVELAERRLFQDAGLVRGGRDDNIRRARIAWLDTDAQPDANAQWVLDRLVETVIAANRRHFEFELDEFAEKAQVAWYGAEQGGHFDWHIDVGEGRLAAKRKLTLVVQLSEDAAYEGGALELNADGRPRAASRKMGAATLFPSFTPHRVTPVSRGQRYSLTTWVHGPAFR